MPSRCTFKCIFIITLTSAFLFYFVVLWYGNSYTINSYLPGLGTSHIQVRTGLPTFNMSDYNFQPRPSNLADGIEFIRHKLRIWSGEVTPEDLKAAGPFDFLPNYRNPCWRDDTGETPPIKCLPYFYLAGISKSGTTDLYLRIEQHPSVSTESRKEPLWFGRSHFYAGSPYPASPTLNDYIKIFEGSIKDIYWNKNKSDWHPKVFGDGSACTLWDNDYWELLPEFEHLPEPLYTNADYIHHLNPSTKIIVILRNPVDRLYSEYLFFNRSPDQYDKGPEDFHQIVIEAVGYLMNCLSRRTLRYCVYHKPPIKSRKVRVRVGIYFVHLNEFLRVFPRKQIHVVRLEEYSTNISSTLRDVYEFLELEPLPGNKLEVISKSIKPQNTRRRKDKAVGDMMPATRKLLEEFYRPYNSELVKLLGPKFDYNRAD